jgi:hypothetical protein
MLGDWLTKSWAKKILIDHHQQPEHFDFVTEKKDFESITLSDKVFWKKYVCILKILFKIRYKKIVGSECDSKYLQFSKYSKEIWKNIVENHLRKMNYIVNNQFDIPTDNYSQSIIFKNQREKYINIDSTIAVLSCFPVFVFDYYGSKTIGILS